MDLKSEVEVLAPFRLEPKFVQRIWGTADLRPWYDFVSDGKADPIGEVWLTGDDCKVVTGPLKGSTLGEVFAGHSKAMMGEGVPESAQGASPLLLKVIFAKEKLSVQVHPDDLRPPLRRMLVYACGGAGGGGRCGPQAGRDA